MFCLCGPIEASGNVRNVRGGEFRKEFEQRWPDFVSAAFRCLGGIYIARRIISRSASDISPNNQMPDRMEIETDEGGRKWLKMNFDCCCTRLIKSRTGYSYSKRELNKIVATASTQACRNWRSYSRARWQIRGNNTAQWMASSILAEDDSRKNRG